MARPQKINGSSVLFDVSNFASVLLDKSSKSTEAPSKSTEAPSKSTEAPYFSTCHSVLFDAQLNSLSSLLLELRAAPLVVPGPPALLAAVLLPRVHLAMRLLLRAHACLAALFGNVFRRIIVLLPVLLAARRRGRRRRRAGHSKAVAAQVVAFALAVADLVAEDGRVDQAAPSPAQVPSRHLGLLHSCHVCVARAVLRTRSSIARAAPLCARRA